MGTSKAAAKAFVRHYIDLVNYAMNSGDTQPLKLVSSPRCESCVAIARNIDSTYRARGYIKSQGWLLQVVSAVPLQPKSRPIFDLGILMRPERVADKKGAKAKYYKGGKQPMTMYLARSRGQWRVTRLDLVS